MAGDFGIASLNRGETADGARNIPEVGFEKDFPNLAAITDTAPRDARRLRMRIVYNDTGSALLPGQGFTYKTGYPGQRAGQLSSAGDIPDGFVDHLLPSAGVAAGSLFWAAIRGPAKVISDGNSTLALGDTIVSVGSATGKVRKQNASPGDDAAAMVQATSVVGKCEDVVAGTDGLLFFCNLRGPCGA